jgi:hypothetical protein
MGYRVKFELVGDMPLLMHRDNIREGTKLQAWRKDRKNKNQSTPGDDRSPAWTWATYLYEDGEVVTMPQENVMRALMTGGSQVILKGQKTYKELSQSAVFMASEHLRFEYGDGKQLTVAQVEAMKELTFEESEAACEQLGFKLFCKRAKIGAAKHVRVRPRFDKWKVLGELTVNSQDLPFDRLKEIFDIAGFAGLCDWRPSSKTPGPYGMFTPSLKVIK